MSTIVTDVWSDKLEEALGGYDVSLIRAIAARLLRARNQWPVDELRERLREAVGNAPVVDRRLKELPPECRKLLTLIGLSRRPAWKVGQLLEMLAALGHTDGITPIRALFDEGLLYPVGRFNGGRLKQFESLLAGGSVSELRLFAHPMVTQRVRAEDLGLPRLPQVAPSRPEVHEADGLEWPLRMAVVWQQVSESSLRRTIQQDFFKRDIQRLRVDPLLAAPFADHLADVPDRGLLAVALARQVGLLRDADADLQAIDFDARWDDTTTGILAEAWRALPAVEAWGPAGGWEAGREGGNPFPTVYPLALALLGRQAESAWVRPADVAGWLAKNHPFWGDAAAGDEWSLPLLLGLFYQLKLVQCAPAPHGEWLIRLSNIGRWLLAPAGPPPPPAPFPQTLIVQPNFQVLLFRQGLTPGVIAELSRFARWKSLGTACLLELGAEQVYHGLESGLTLEGIRSLLQRHAMRPVPDNVVDALRTWSNKRDRIVVYSNAAIIEFGSPADLDEALRRGLVEVKLTDRLGLVGDEESVDYRQLRLTGTRDYGERAEKCVTVEEDGLTLTIDAGRADLLLETELSGLAEPVEQTAERRSYRLTRASLQRAIQAGRSFFDIDEWMTQRAGQPLSPAARLLAAPEETIDFRIESCLVIHAPTSLLADALMQWPETRGLIRQRLGPTALSVAEAELPRLREAIEGLKQRLPQVESSPHAPGDEPPREA